MKIIDNDTPPPKHETNNKSIFNNQEPQKTTTSTPNPPSNNPQKMQHNPPPPHLQPELTFQPHPECTKIAHRRSLAILIADEGIARNSATRIIFTRLHRRKNRGSLAIFFAEEIAHRRASKIRAMFPGAVKIAAATAENRAILVHSSPSCDDR